MHELAGAIIGRPRLSRLPWGVKALPRIHGPSDAMFASGDCWVAFTDQCLLHSSEGGHHLCDQGLPTTGLCVGPVGAVESLFLLMWRW